MIVLREFTYQERGGTPGEWTLHPARFRMVNLLVGQNASGKTRVLNVIYGLASVIQNNVRPLWQSGTYKAMFSSDIEEYHYEIEFQDRTVSSELLSIDGKIVLERHADGSGMVWSTKLGQELEFKLDGVSVAVVAKRDQIQHPFLELLHQWAKSVRRYPFGSEMGRTNILAHAIRQHGEQTSSETEYVSSDEPDAVTKLYISGFELFGESFDNQILSDFARVGYDCIDVSANTEIPVNVPFALPPNTFPVMLAVQERSLNGLTWQHEMSMGMFRALAIIVHLNYTLMTNQATCILIDDIGEGLDFERSQNLIHLIIEKSKQANIQLIMTTNDRFVMNEVPLEFWHVINRIGSDVRLISQESEPERFDEFRFLGLSNFDFFKSKAYLPGQE